MPLSVKERYAGATRINSHEEGVGDKLVFENIPYSLSGALLEELSGLDANYLHPLQGANYCTDNQEETFTITVYESNMKSPLAETFAKWFMSDLYKPYVSDETKAILY